MDEAPCGAAGGQWSDLIEEFERWGETGRTAKLWWRDDDAVAPSARLDRLFRLTEGIPLGLAVIPALAQPQLAAACAYRPRVAVLQHGWQHINHAEPGGKKSEYPAGRSASLVEAEIGAGAARLKSLFGAQARPVFVPPWNRFAAEFLPVLSRVGLKALSASRSDRAMTPTEGGLSSIDAAFDPVAWRSDRRFIGERPALAALVDALRQHRLVADRDAHGMGILTHHLVMDEATAAFLEQLIDVTNCHSAVRWVGVDEAI